MTVIRRPAWHADAACLGEPLSTFFVEQHATAEARRAKAICTTCPVKAACLAEHLGEDHGIFAGTGPRERRRLRQVEHGTITMYVNYDCRCDKCRAANAAKSRRYYYGAAS